ncbi:MAG TPA: hypothetical protein VMW27_12185 [Thermoanaerobaculia bacterium]|nr:hypothetical protein [Thermoanaerobaculia bacterium]
MIKRSAILLAGLLALPALAAAAVQPVDNATLQKSATRACQRAERVLLGFAGECVASSIQRRVLSGDVAEYSFDIRTGAGPYDVIGIHRVVRESAPFQPVKTDQAVLAAHGDIWGFDAAFVSNPAQNLPVFLAQNGVDVWGIDFRWTRVPATETDFSSFRNWGVETDARDLYVALGVARAVRLYTGNGFDSIHLLGWSRGGIISYAYLNAETQFPGGFTNVTGFIPVDIYLKTDVPELQKGACDRAAAGRVELGNGNFASQNGVLVSTLGFLALTAPNDPSPVPLFPGFTNRQAALFVGEATFALANPVPFYHFTGGTFDANGLPSGLLYTDETSFFQFELGASPFQPLLEIVESDVAACDNPNDGVAFDDHLGEIDVPVLYVGAGGGFGEFGVYTTTLLGSTDVTTHIVDLTPDEARLFDYGHADLFLADDAQTRVWQPILSWIQAH